MDSALLAQLVDRAYSPDLTATEATDLLGHQDVQIAMALAANEATPGDSLAELAVAFPQLAGLAAENPRAPAQLKDTIALGRHTGLSIERYLNDRGATHRQRIALIAMYDQCEPGHGPLLSEAWATVSAS